jgi:hypothetical protein
MRARVNDRREKRTALYRAETRPRFFRYAPIFKNGPPFNEFRGFAFV